VRCEDKRAIFSYGPIISKSGDCRMGITEWGLLH